MKRFWMILSAVFYGSAAMAYTNVLDGGVTNTVKGIWTNATDITVGSASSANVLNVELGSYVSNSTLRVGVGAGADGNLVQLREESGWLVSGDLSVGVTGSANRVEILGGSGMLAENAYVGVTAGANSNAMLLAGSGSSLVLGNTLYVGADGNSGNSVLVTNSAWLVTTNLVISAGNDFYLEEDGGLAISELDAGQSGFHWNDGSSLEVYDALSGLDAVSGSNKSLYVEDAEWNIADSLVVSGMSNQVYVQSSTVVESGAVSIGGEDSQGLYLLVTGENTEWTAAGDWSVAGGTSNKLVVSDGAVVSSTALSLGGAGADGNQIYVTGDDTEWTVGGELFVGGGSSNSMLAVRDGAALSSTTARIGDSLSQSNIVVVTGSGSLWQVTDGSVTVEGDGNQLIVQSSGLMVVGDVDADDLDVASGLVVASSDGSGAVSITNGASVWAGAGVAVGTDDGNEGAVEINDGGMLTAGPLTIGDDSSVSLNAGGTLKMLSSFDAGMDGFSWNDGSTLSVSYGWLYGLTVTNVAGDDITRFGGSDKTVTLDESGIWAHGDNHLAIGWTGGSGNALLVTNGGAVYAETAYVGYGSDSNSVVVTGTGSLLELDDTLYVGWSNSVGNAVTVSDGGQVTTENLIITNGTFTLEEAGILDVAGDFKVLGDADGFQWNSGELELSGTLVWDGNLDRTNQALTLTGAAASWQDRESTDLMIGSTGSANEMNILAGASVSNINAFVGQQAGAYSNAVAVSGTDSIWVNSGTLTIGAVAANNYSNSVTVASGGTVQAEDLMILGTNFFYLNDGGSLDMTGDFDASQTGLVWRAGGELVAEAGVTDISSTVGTNRLLTLNGGMLVETNGSFYWGSVGYGNRLTVSNAGAIVSSGTYIGDGEEADDNSITLRGDGTVWTDSGEIAVGYAGSGNSLSVANSGTVHSASGVIGVLAGADSNSVSVSGSNSAWFVESHLTVGSAGSGNNLVIADHGLVTNQLAEVGFTGDDNSVLVSGDGAAWLNDELYVGSETLSFSTNYQVGTSGRTNVVIISATISTEDNSVTVENGGRIETRLLNITAGNEFQLNDDGTLRITDAGAFNITDEQYEGLSWNSGGNLSLAGELLGMDTTNRVVAAGTTNIFGYLDGGKLLTLDGSAAEWNNENLILGYGSGSTGLILTNGGSVAQATAYIGWDGSGKNEVLVTDESMFTSTSNLYLGVYHDESGEVQDAGRGNSLVVSSGGWALVGDVTTNNFAGDQWGIAVAATNGAEIIVGNDSSMTTDGGLWVGAGSSQNGSVTATNGGTVTAETLTIADGSLFNIDEDGTLLVTGDYDYLAQSNVVWNSGGALAVGGALTGLDGLDGTNRTLSVDGSNAVWNLSGSDLDIGTTGDGNLLNIVNGGTVINSNAFVGSTIQSDQNAVYVSGSNSVWNVQGELAVGLYESEGSQNVGNAVVVEDNGTVMAATLNIATNSAFYLYDGGTLEMQGDFDVSADEHQALVWSAGGNLAIKGELTGMPTTNLFNGAADYLAGERHLTLLEGGSWNVDTNLIVGFNSSSTLLTITNNASLVVGNDAFVGWDDSAKNNGVFVSDASLLDIGGDLYLGVYYDENDEAELVYAGSGNSLTQTNSGWVVVGDFNTNGYAGGVGVGTTQTLVVGNGSLYAYDGVYIDGGTNWVMTNGMVVASALQLDNGGVFELDGSLEMLGDLDAGQNGFTWNNGGSVSITNGVFSGLDLLDGSNKVLVLEDSSWTNAGFVVSGTNHTISISDSSAVYSAASVVLGSDEDWGNSITIENTGAVWMVAGDFSVGATNDLSVVDSGSLLLDGSLSLAAGSSLTMETSSVVSVGGNLSVSNSTLAGAGTIGFSAADNTFAIDGSNTVISSELVFDAGNGADTVAVREWEFTVSDNIITQFVGFEALELTDATLGGSGTLDAFDRVLIDGGTIAPAGSLYLASATVFSNTPTLAVTVDGTSSADQLRVGGSLSNVTLAAEITIADNISNVSEMKAVILKANGGGLTDVFDSVEFDEHYLFYSFGLTNPAPTTVTVVATPRADGEINPSVSYAAWRGVRAGFNGMKNTVDTRTRQLQRNWVATPGAVPSDAYRLKQSTGARGPGDHNAVFGMHFWVEQFSGVGSCNVNGQSSEFDLSYYGTTMGLDRQIGDSLVAGVSYTHSSSRGSSDAADSADTETYWLSLYGEWVNEEGTFVDALLGAGWSGFDTVRQDVSYEGYASYDGFSIGGHVNAGSYFHHENWALAPYVGLHYLGSRIDGHTETESSGNEIHVGEIDPAALESAVGLKVRNRVDTGLGRIQTTAYVEWLYDFINDDIGTTLSDGSISLQTDRIMPDANSVNAGLGLGWFCTDGVEIGLGYDGRFNDGYEEHMGTASLNVMF